MTISRELLEILVCPKCMNSIELDEEKQKIICKSCKVFYEIKDGIPIILVDKAIPIDELN